MLKFVFRLCKLSLYSLFFNIVSSHNFDHSPIFFNITVTHFFSCSSRFDPWVRRCHFNHKDQFVLHWFCCRHEDIQTAPKPVGKWEPAILSAKRKIFYQKERIKEIVFCLCCEVNHWLNWVKLDWKSKLTDIKDDFEMLKYPLAVNFVSATTNMWVNIFSCNKKRMFRRSF